MIRFDSIILLRRKRKVQHASPAALRRGGMSLLEGLFLLALGGFLLLLTSPLLLQMRETSRRQTCQLRLKSLTAALRQYHDVHQTFPPAAIWDHAVTDSLALHRSRRIELVTQANWALLILPYLQVPFTAGQLPMRGAIGATENTRIRETSLTAMACPDDSFNRRDNPFRLVPVGQTAALQFARGNYAINGGTHHFETDPPTTASPHGDAVHLVMSASPRRYEMWGNGIAGINHAFRIDDFVNGQGTLVAIEEVRAGIHPLDPRGVWSLGQIGGSLTWGHGVNGDDAGPNQAWVRGDDILNCEQLHREPGTEVLRRENMPCVDYVNLNQQATSRSRHPGGVSVSLLDGAVRFISNSIDPGLWHVLHSRETPAASLPGRLDQREIPQQKEPSVPVRVTSSQIISRSRTEKPLQEFQNSIGQTFRRLPPGTFRMGLPDRADSTPIPPECLPHQVTLTHDFWMGTHEVTRAEFQRVLGPDVLPAGQGEEQDAAGADESGSFPVTSLTWNQARDFCETLSALPAEQQAGRFYRLPTEAEWEYACRAGSPVPREWHGERKPGDRSGVAAGIDPPLPLRPVGSYPASAWGLFDMQGNAWEWTADWYARDYYARSPEVDPAGPATGDLKVVRGSDWRFTGETCHIDAAVLPPWKGNPLVGFRVVCLSSK